MSQQQRRAVVRSYQRVFRPDRRIYAIDGRTIPVPGGVPLRWLAYAATVAAGVAVIAGRSPVVALVGAVLAYMSGARLGRRLEGATRAAVVGSTLTIVGWVVGVLDWPTRFVVVPAVAATALSQITPDGRSLHRHLWSLAQVRIAGRRRVGEALPVRGQQTVTRAAVRIARDEHRPTVVRGRVAGPCRVRFAEPVVLHRRRRGRAAATPVATAGRVRGAMVETVELAIGERLELRP
ncbi:hypothetical protein [Conexibacter woesei]|uniref:hypothetical protein n=1 Tax=Conexibacter woesei TaxID=191495 RepID=UPI0003F8E69E|nr:hypothetical protein [Conexibacter woesei]